MFNISLFYFISGDNFTFVIITRFHGVGAKKKSRFVSRTIGQLEAPTLAHTGDAALARVRRPCACASESCALKHSVENVRHPHAFPNHARARRGGACDVHPIRIDGQGKRAARVVGRALG